MNIQTIARNALNAAWTAAASTLTACVLKTGPTPTYDAATDQTSVAWTAETALSALLYEDEKKEEDALVSAEGARVVTTTKKALLRRADCPETDITLDDRISIAGAEWNISKIETPPGNAAVILTIQK